ncbi:MAG: FAD-dependent monooxygenase [Candidatus Dadabacteria bacterium]|nr:FAD-dependent monooxygenase [Candidatus Dadabacteria bacterium]
MSTAISSNGHLRYGPDMKILIVGGGIAGLTLCGLLEQRGFRPTLVERASGFGDVGYIIVVWPSGSRILKGLRLYELLKERGCAFSDYNISNYRGKIINSYTIDSVVEKYGPIISIYRPDLIEILTHAVSRDSIRMNTTVTSFEDTPQGVETVFSDGSTQTYDLVVGCDGIRSWVRKKVFGDVPLRYSGMSGWGFWVSRNLCAGEGIIEYWGKGKFLGMWPTRGRLAVFTSVRRKSGVPDAVDTRVENIRRNFSGFAGVVPEILRSLDDPGDIYYDEYNDLRMDSWSRGRVVLAGDSVHAILPNAGAGASMAMESAAVLAEELCRTDSLNLSHAFWQYESRRKARVNKVQNQSRIMGKFIYTESSVLSSVRDYIVKAYSSRQLFKYWDSMLKDPL